MSRPALETGGGEARARGVELEGTRAFFGPRAASWEDRFPDDAPRYERAVAELAPPTGGRALDAGCGTGRALPFLGSAVGPTGVVVGIDVTREMLREASDRHPGAAAALVLGDVMSLPFAGESFDAVLAAGLVTHLPEPIAGLSELARVCRAGAGLALFHPIGRAALARRHGRELSPDDVRSEPIIRSLLDRAGWHCTSVDDAEDRYLVLAVRR